MKILFDHSQPFCLAHGGFEVQIRQTKAGLERVGVTVEFMRWWDPTQTGDLIHYFGRPTAIYVELAQAKGMKVVIAELLTASGSRSRPALLAQKSLIRLARLGLPPQFIQRFSWDAFQLANAVVAGTQAEADLFSDIFGVAKQKIVRIENGVEDVFFDSAKVARGKWLLCTATITERKRVLELAQAAVQAQVPVWIIGKPYSEGDAYWKSFLRFAQKHPEYVRYEGAVGDRNQLAGAYRQARGFVLLSSMETLSLSSGEAAACECPLLLSDLPWARSAFPEGATFCPLLAPEQTATILRRFYDAAPTTALPRKPKTWADIGTELTSLYRSLLNNSV